MIKTKFLLAYRIVVAYLLSSLVVCRFIDGELAARESLISLNFFSLKSRWNEKRKYQLKLVTDIWLCMTRTSLHRCFSIFFRWNQTTQQKKTQWEMSASNLIYWLLLYCVLNFGLITGKTFPNKTEEFSNSELSIPPRNSPWRESVKPPNLFLWFCFRGEIFTCLLINIKNPNPREICSYHFRQRIIDGKRQK